MVEIELYRVPVWAGAVLVVGDPEMGAYEWVYIAADGAELARSRAGYGLPAAALRDGLIHALTE